MTDATPNADSGTKRDLRPVAAHMQGAGIGLCLGMVTTLATTDTAALVGITGIAFVSMTAGYILDKRSVDAGKGQ